MHITTSLYFGRWILNRILDMRIRSLLNSRRRIVKFLLLTVALFALYHFIKYFIEVTGLSRQVEPGAVKGYPHCEVHADTLRNYTLKNPCDFNPRPSSNGTIIVTFINSAWLSLAQNWVCSAKKVGITDSVFLVSFEHGVCSHFPDVKCYEHPHVVVHETAFGKAAYKTLVTERTRVILRLLSCGQRLALVDADVTFLKNPMKYLESVIVNKDVVFQADSVGVGFVDSVLPIFFSYICGGFIYMKPTYSTKRLWLSVLQYQLNFFWNDQAGLNVCIRHYTQTVTWNTLDGRYFPSGRQFFFYEESDINEVLIIHANHLQGIDKHIRMIGSHVWCYDDYAKRLCHDRSTFRSRCGGHIFDGHLPKWCKLFVDACFNLYGSTLT